MDEKMNWLWQASFEDGATMTQPEDDRSIKHVEGAEHNPSSFTDFLDKNEKSPWMMFKLVSADGNEEYEVNREDLMVYHRWRDDKDGEWSGEVLGDIPLLAENIRVIYFRTIQRNFHTGELLSRTFTIGWQALFDGENMQNKWCVV